VDAEPPKPRRRPRQARSQAIVDAIFHACERILSAEGPDALNTNRIAEVAGVNIASVYRYFPNKEAIVAELYERHLAAYAEMLDGLDDRAAEIDALSLEATLRFAVEAMAELHLRLLAIDADFYRRHRERFDLASRVYPRHERRWIEQMQTWLGEVLERHRARLCVADVERAAFLVAHTLTGAFQAAVRDAPTRIGEVGFRDDLRRLVTGFLIGPSDSGTQALARGDGVEGPSAS
jgi:AcrR family transcriptional regulator